jgi:cyclophilin family peptidyl-prolyl cis-trans isomerase
MNELGKTHRVLRRTSGLLFSACCVALAAAQEEATRPSDPLEFLRAEVTADRGLFAPSQPLPVRFTLFNSTSQPIEIPVVQTGGQQDAVALPRMLITGTPEQPALFIAYEDEKAVPIRPEARSENEGTPGTLRLAPRAAIGAEIDLTEAHRLLRYSGRYRVEWQPLGGRIPPASLSFRVEARKDAVLVTDLGKVTFALLYEKAPRNVENFLELVRDRFYDGKTIHRVVPGFIAQGGSPTGTGTGIRPDGKFAPAEFHDAPFEAGTLAMARKPSDPDSASCQFFISLARLPELDGKYTIIGQAQDEESLRTLQQIAAVPTDNEDRPVRPLVIRFFTLVDSAAGETREPQSFRR